MTEQARTEDNGAPSRFHGALSEADRLRLNGSLVLLAGLGNIGSHVGPLLARMGVRNLRIIDCGLVERKNLVNQAYADPAHIGRPKATVLAEQVRRISAEISVDSIVADIAEVPLGKFADIDLCLGGFDSLQARQVMANERAYRMGLPYIDGGVDAGGDWIGRVQVLMPGKSCIECSWGEDHYREIGRETPCNPDDAVTTTPTLAPALLGSSVASLMAAEAVKLLLGHMPPESFEITFDLASRRWLTSTLRPASRCRFDHQIISETLMLSTPFGAATVGDLLAVLEGRFGDAPVQLEFCRRICDTDRYQGGRFVTANYLKHLASRRLTELRLLPDDRICVKHGAESVALALQDLNPTTERMT